MKLRLVAVSLCALFGATLAQSAEPLTLRVATPFAKGHILADTALRFKQELERRAPHIKVSVEASVLNEQTINPAMQGCKASERVAEIMLTGGQPLQDYTPRYFFFNGPYVIRDWAHLMDVWHGELGEAMVGELEANGKIVSLEPVYRGYRQFTSNTPITTPADFKGLKLRLPPIKDWIAVWDSLGTQTVQVPLPGIYDALKTGAAEASEGDLTQIQSLKLYEVQSQLVLTNHLVGFGVTAANACFYRNELSAADRGKVRSAMRKAARWGTQKIQANEAAIIAQLQEAGMKVVQPDAEAIRKAAEPSIAKLFANNWTATSWQDVLDE